MKNINDLLEKMSDVSKDFGEEKITMKDEEKKRIYDDTMKKISENKLVDIDKKREKAVHKGFWKNLSKPAVAIIVIAIICMASVTAFAAFNLDDTIRNFFGIYDDSTKEQVDKLTTQVNTKSEDNGVTVSIPQVIGDNTRFYAVLSVENLPETNYELEFEDVELKATGKNGKNYDFIMDYPKMGAVTEKVTKFGLLLSGINDNGKDVDIDGKNFDFTLINIGYHVGEKFVPVVKGKWKLNWTFHTEADTKKINVNKKTNIMDSKGIWKDIVVSPISVTVHYNITKQGKEHFSSSEYAKYEKTNRLVVQLTDGTRIDSRFSDDINESWGTKKNAGYKSIGFKRVIDTKKIQSITFANKTVVLNKNAKLEKRVKIISEATKCYVALPPEIEKMITLEEKTDTKNNDFNCNESYSIFWAEKNKAKMPLFTIHRLDGMFSPEEMDTMNPMMVYIGSDGECTYGIIYGEIQEENQYVEFTDILNKYVGTILPYFEYEK